MSQQQLQFFDRKTKRYVPALSELAEPEHARSIARGRDWRIVRGDRDLRPVFRRPVSTASNRTVDEVRAEYLRWAIAAGLSCITDWQKKFTQPRPFYYGDVKTVSPEAFFAVEYSEVAEGQS